MSYHKLKTTDKMTKFAKNLAQIKTSISVLENIQRVIDTHSGESYMDLQDRVDRELGMINKLSNDNKKLVKELSGSVYNFII